ncbi:class I SAM-dependent methyltransferase [Streptomyces sp. NBC_01537]
MSTTEAPRYAPEWLELREGADAAARAAELVEPLRRRLADPARPIGQAIVIRDLGCGSGSMGRWLAPRLDGPQHWVLHDHDPDLLDLAAERMPTTAADGSLVTVETVRGDVTGLTAEDLAGTSLVTASALLDLFTRDEVDALAAACARAGCPALLALSVMGRVELEPADPLDAEIAAAFNAHQRREDHGRRLLGPDAVTAACEAFDQRDTTVRVHNSPWQLGSVRPILAGSAASGTAPRGVAGTPSGNHPEGAPAPCDAPHQTPRPIRPGSAGQTLGDDHRALTAEWLRGWTGAAVEQRPDLGERAEEYLRLRLEQCEAGELRAVVHHSDLLALPRQAGGTTRGTTSGTTGGTSS